MKRLLIALVLCIALVGVVAADTMILTPSNNADLQEESDNTWTALRNDVGDYAYNNRTVYHRVGLYNYLTTNIYDYNSRAALTFDTSSLPDDALVTSASVSLYVNNKFNSFGTTNLSICDIFPLNKNSYTSGDYHNTSFTRYASDLSYSAISTGAYNNVTLTNISWISKTGYSSLMVIHSVDVDNGTFVWTNTSTGISGYNIYPKGYSGGTYSPLLTLTYTPAPLSLTSLTNSSPLCNSLQFNYTVPAGVGEILVYRNNTQLANQTNSSIAVLWEGLPESTAITFSARTCSIDGLVCNSTWTNMTTNTGACGVAPVANFTSNRTEACTVDPIQFNDTSTNTPTGWSWSFGDGNTSAEQNPVKTYNITGLYTVGLIASNAYGEDEEEKTNYINVSVCGATPTPTPTPTVTATPTLCYYVNATGATIADNFTNLSFNAGPSSWGVTVWNQSEGNISWWQCGSLNVSTGDPGSGGGEATGAALGLVGGLLGALMVLRRDDKS